VSIGIVAWGGMELTQRAREGRSEAGGCLPSGAPVAWLESDGACGWRTAPEIDGVRRQVKLAGHMLR
jgi:hypothetical protein